MRDVNSLPHKVTPASLLICSPFCRKILLAWEKKRLSADALLAKKKNEARGMCTVFALLAGDS